MMVAVAREVPMPLFAAVTVSNRSAPWLFPPGLAGITSKTGRPFLSVPTIVMSPASQPFSKLISTWNGTSGLLKTRLF